MASSASSYTFLKDERLSRKSEIQRVFSESRSFVIFPFKFLFVPNEKKHPSILFTVPKRNFKKAVDRNFIKRQLKEIYRKNKIDKELDIVVIFLSKEKIPFNILENKLILGLNRLQEQILDINTP